MAILKKGEKGEDWEIFTNKDEYNNCHFCKKKIKDGELMYLCATNKKVFCEKCSKSRDNNVDLVNICAKEYTLPFYEQGGFVSGGADSPHIHQKVRRVIKDE